IKMVIDLTANALLLLGPVVLLVLRPAPVEKLVKEAGSLLGWLALLITLGPAAWRFRQVAGRFGVAVICVAGLSLGVLAASSAGYLDREDWLAYHVLTGLWATTGLVLVAI